MAACFVAHNSLGVSNCVTDFRRRVSYYYDSPKFLGAFCGNNSNFVPGMPAGKRGDSSAKGSRRRSHWLVMMSRSQLQDLREPKRDKAPESCARDGDAQLAEKPKFIEIPPGVAAPVKPFHNLVQGRRVLCSVQAFIVRFKRWQKAIFQRFTGRIPENYPRWLITHRLAAAHVRLRSRVSNQSLERLFRNIAYGVEFLL